MEPNQKLSISLIPVDKNNFTEYADLLLKNCDELKSLYIETGTYNSYEKISNYVFLEHDSYEFPIMAIYINGEIKGQISVDHWNKLGEIVFWLDPSARGTGAFKNIVKVFLDKFFAMSDKPLIWATSEIASKSTYMSKCFGFNKLCSYYEHDLRLSKEPYLTNVHWIYPKTYWAKVNEQNINYTHEVNIWNPNLIIELLNINQADIINF